MEAIILVVVTVANQKGGVSKSTTAEALGADLFSRGNSVLFIDLDPQSNMTETILNQEVERSIYEVLSEKAKLQDVLVHTDHGDIVPAAPSLSAVDTEITIPGREYRLKEALEAVSGKYSYVIIDTGPALGLLTTNALTASDYLIVPAMADIYCLQSLGQLYSTVSVIQKYTNRNLQIAGVLLTRFSSRTVLSRDMAEMIDDMAKEMGTRVFDAHIREGVAIREAQAQHTDIFSYAPKSNPALDYKAFTDEFLRIAGGK